jgi:hypothetical protein
VAVSTENHNQACWYLNNVSDLNIDQMAEAMTYTWFRINTLYKIKTKASPDEDEDCASKVITFKANKEQEHYYLNSHTRDVILKVRQLGFTTFKMIQNLDSCLFVANFASGVICHKMDDAKKIFRNKIKFAFESITQVQREIISEMGYELPLAKSDTSNSYVFSNGSSVEVSTGYRGDTLDDLHVSEFGKICRNSPDVAKEIISGAFEAVPVNGSITLESTADGREGYYYEICQDGLKNVRLQKVLSNLDWKGHFYSWFQREEYILPGGDIAQTLIPYFDNLEATLGIVINDDRRAWYSGKWNTLRDEMRQEYPTTPEEAFEKTIQGAYYKTQFTEIHKEKRICSGFGNDARVNTAWDLGVGDSTAIWFWQEINNQIHFVDYYENSGEGLDHYAKYIRNRGIAKKYTYGTHYGPHDIDNRQFSATGAKTTKQVAAIGFDLDDDGQLYKIIFQTVPKLGVDQGINHARKLLDKSVFDEKTCELGIKALEAYRKAWNDKGECWRDQPLHDWSSHGADAFRYAAVTILGRKKAVFGPKFK